MGNIFKRSDSIDPRGVSRFGQESVQGKIPFRKIQPEHIADLDIIVTGTWNFYPSSGSVPFVVGPSYTTVVTNLNADMVDGLHSSDIPSLGSPLTQLTIPHADTSTTLADSILSMVGSGTYIRNTGWFQVEGRDGSNTFLIASIASTLDQYIRLAGNTSFMGFKASTAMDFYTTAASSWPIHFRPGEIGDGVIMTTTGLSWGGGAEIASSDDAGGNVSNTGTPADNQIAVWTDATTIEGDSDLAWSGAALTVGGDIDPGVAATYDLGDTTLYWQNIYAEGMRYIQLDKGAKSSTFAVDFAAGSIQYVNLTNSSSVAVTFSNVSSGDVLMLKIRRGSNSGGLTWPAGVDWGDNGAPTIPTVAGQAIAVLFVPHNGSTEVQGMMVDGGAEWSLADV